MTLHPLDPVMGDERDTSIDRARLTHDAATCKLCAYLAEGRETTKNGVFITPLCDGCGTHHPDDYQCFARFKCAECKQLLPLSQQEWARLGIVRLAHGKRTRPHPTGVCKACFPFSSRNTARELVTLPDDGRDVFEGLGR